MIDVLEGEAHPSLIQITGLPRVQLQRDQPHGARRECGVVERGGGVRTGDRGRPVHGPPQVRRGMLDMPWGVAVCGWPTIRLDSNLC